MPATDYGEYIFTPTSGSPVTLNKNTVSDEDGPLAQMAFFHFLGVAGEQAIKIFEQGGILTLHAWLHESSESGLQTAMDAIKVACAAGVPGTLSVRGASKVWDDTILVAPPRFTGHYPYDALTGTCGCMVTLVFKQLIPNSEWVEPEE